MSLAELQALTTSVRVAPLAPPQTARSANIPKYGTTMLLAAGTAITRPVPATRPARRRFMNQKSA